MATLRSLSAAILCVICFVVMATFTRESSGVAAAAESASRPVFCTDVGVDFGFQRRETVTANEHGDATSGDAVATSCLRHPMMMAATDYMAAKMHTLALSAVDCVHEAVHNDTGKESGDAALFAVLSMCSRSNIQQQSNDLSTWDADIRAQLEQVFDAESSKQGVGVGNSFVARVRQVLVSPPYALPDGKGMPRFEFKGAKMWVDSSGFANVQVDVRNVGKVPLHLYRVTLTELIEGEASSVPPATFALLPSPAMVDAGKSDSVLFTSSTASSPATLTSSKSYVVYISHSGFRSHRFDGVLEGVVFKPKSAVVSGVEKTDDFFGIVSQSSAIDPMMTAFPFGSWRATADLRVSAADIATTQYTHHQQNQQNEQNQKQFCQNARCEWVEKQDIRRGDERRHFFGSGIGRVGKCQVRAFVFDAVRTKRVDLVTAIDKFSKQPSEEATPIGSSRKVMMTPSLAASEKDMLLVLMHSFQSNEVQIGHMDSADLIKKMQALGITCMASGTVSGIEKYVFYAKQRESDWFFFLVVDITLATSSMGVTVRTSSDASELLVQDFVKLAKTTLREAVKQS